MSTSPTHMGPRLRTLRESAGISRTKLARRTGVNESAVKRLERGDDVRVSTYFPIAGYFLEVDADAWMLAELLLELRNDQRCMLIEYIERLLRAEAVGHGSPGAGVRVGLEG